MDMLKAAKAATASKEGEGGGGGGLSGLKKLQAQAKAAGQMAGLAKKMGVTPAQAAKVRVVRVGGATKITK